MAALYSIWKKSNTKVLKNLENLNLKSGRILLLTKKDILTQIAIPVYCKFGNDIDSLETWQL